MNSIIKALVIIDPPFVIKRKYKDNIIYEGILYDFWKYIKKNSKLKVQETYTNKYNIFHDYDSVKEYDIIICYNEITYEGYQKYLYTIPILLDPIKIAHYPQSNLFIDYFNILKTFIKPILIIIIVGITSGYILHKLEPHRPLKRALYSGVASLLGEMGRISEENSLSFKGALFGFFIMMISYYSVIYLQATTIDKVRSNSYDRMEPNNIGNSKILIRKNSPKIKYLKDNYNMNLIELKDNNLELGIYNHYKKNKKKYGGFIITMFEENYLMSKDNKLKLSNFNYGYQSIAFILNKKNIKLKNILDLEIIKAHNDNHLINICSKYIDNKNIVNCHL